MKKRKDFSPPRHQDTEKRNGSKQKKIGTADERR
jgi:hypothetical protein